MNPDFFFNVTQKDDITYDIEVFPNTFTLCAESCSSDEKWFFEISDRRDDRALLIKFMDVCRANVCRWVGFNNLGYDYIVVHFIYSNQNKPITNEHIYNKSIAIIGSNGPAKYAHMVWESDHVVKQLDLFKIHHFDNRGGSLKMMEFNMAMGSIEDMPFEFGIILNDQQKDVLIKYNWYDVKATKLFYFKTTGMIQLREELGRSLGLDLINCSNIKMGEKILVQQMEQHKIKCYEYIGGKRHMRQTNRDVIILKDAILPMINFEHCEFKRVTEFLKSKEITETKGVFKKLIATVDGIEYKFGTGGIHASVDDSIVESTDEMQIIDVDVSSFYPNLSIKNKFYPAHLGVEFCDAYNDLYLRRQSYDKGTPENAGFKEGLVGAFGGSNFEYSPLFDPHYTMQITLNGQLLLCMLVEQLLKVPGLKMIQANTDGITFITPVIYIEHTRNLCRWWESITKLELEEVFYNRMFIRDVNSYIAEKSDGKLKRIGDYAYETIIENPGTRELLWWKDWSHRVVAKAAEAHLVRGEDIREFIENHTDQYDFMLRTKVPKNSILEHGGVKVGNIIRYYMSTDGKGLEKIMPPGGPDGQYKRANKLTDAYYNEILNEIGLGVWDERIHTKNKSVYSERRSGVQAGWLATICNDKIDLKNVDYDWYIARATKLATLSKFNGC